MNLSVNRDHNIPTPLTVSNGTLHPVKHLSIVEAYIATRDCSKVTPSVLDGTETATKWVGARKPKARGAKHNRQAHESLAHRLLHRDKESLYFINLTYADKQLEAGYEYWREILADDRLIETAIRISLELYLNGKAHKGIVSWTDRYTEDNLAEAHVLAVEWWYNELPTTFERYVAIKPDKVNRVICLLYICANCVARRMINYWTRQKSVNAELMDFQFSERPTDSDPHSWLKGGTQSSAWMHVLATRDIYETQLVADMGSILNDRQRLIMSLLANCFTERELVEGNAVSKQGKPILRVNEALSYPVPVADRMYIWRTKRKITEFVLAH